MDYLIAATPRVGSNLLCSLLMGTQRLGECREALCPSEFGEFAERIQRDRRAFQAYYAARRARESKGGPFGVKAHFHQLVHAVELGFDLGANFPSRVVYLRRADVVGQAISHVRAAQTGAWISRKEERAEPRFDPEAIHRAIGENADHEHGWESFFRQNDVLPYRLGYESLCADFEGELTRLLPFLGVDPGTVDVARVVASSTSALKKQRDGLSDEWRARYTEWIAGRSMATAA
ncbi:MAG: Stf0 family sulfotransferase [Planctomycetota bacterium]